MTPTVRRLVPALVLVALVQTVALGWMVADRIWLLRSGREVVLPIVPVDPRSLFRGDYVDLAYDISRVPSPFPAEARAVRNRPIYVTLTRQADGSWQRSAVSATRPAALGPDQVVLAGRTQRHWWQRPGTQDIGVHYGIESYFVAEGKGLELEKMVLDKKMAAILSVDAKGRAAIKGLMIDGTKVYDEPLL